MTNTERMLLDDAIRTAIKGEMRLAKFKRVIVIETVTIAVLLGAFIGVLAYG